MIDIHNHQLYGVDDGSRSLEDSISVLRNMSKCGYTDVILTPHYIRDSRYSSNVLNNKRILDELREELRENNININLYLGNEIFMDDDIDELVRSKEARTLNGSEYILIELPMSGEYPDYIDIFRELIYKGYKVILAHPERYIAFQEDYSLIDEIVDEDILLQCNLDSLNGKYGPGAENLIKLLLKNHKVSFLGSDIHHVRSDYSSFAKAREKALKIISKEEFEDLTVNNPSKIIN